MNCIAKNENCKEGWVRTETDYVVCECIRLQNVEKFFNWSDTPKKYFKRLVELEDQNILNGKEKAVSYKKSMEQLFGKRENIQTMIENEFRIVLKGTTGSGKTQYAVTLATEMLANYDLQSQNPQLNKFYFLSIHKLSEIIFNDDKKAKADYHEKIRKAKVLIIDDVGVDIQFDNKKTPYMLDELDHIIRNFEGILILTTNMDDNLKDGYMAYNERLASVILTDREEHHGENNSLFYMMNQTEERRKKKNTGATFL
jgi:DNA replication protein DnaC